MKLVCEHVGLQVRVASGTRDVLRDICLEIEPGSSVLLGGPSGAGKSSLLMVMAGVRRPTSGQVLANDQPISRFIAAHRDIFRRSLGLVPQNLLLMDQHSALENVLLPMMPASRPRAGVYERARELLAELELDPDDPQPVHSFSGGERQRVAVARALIAQPKLVLADEPTAHQDQARCPKVLGLLQKAQQEGATLLVAAHDERVTQLAFDRTLKLEGGRLLEP